MTDCHGCLHPNNIQIDTSSKEASCLANKIIFTEKTPARFEIIFNRLNLDRSTVSYRYATFETDQDAYAIMEDSPPRLSGSLSRQTSSR